MLVSHRNEFIFIKTHRSASTSIEVLLQPFCADDANWDIITHEEKQPMLIDKQGIIGYRGPAANRDSIIYHSHMSIGELTSLLGLETVNKYFKFCVIRDPWTRLVSAYMDFPSSGRDFERFVRERYHVYDDWKLYTIDDQVAMDFVIRFDYLKSDLKKVLAKIGIHTKIINHMKEFKKTKEKRRGLKWKSFYSKELNEFVQKNFEKEIANFGFVPPWVKNKK